MVVYIYVLCSAYVCLTEAIRVAKLETYTVQQLTGTILKIVFAPFWLFGKAMDWALKVDFLNWRIF